MLQTDLSIRAAEQFHCLVIVHLDADVLQYLQNAQNEGIPLVLRKELKPRPTRGGSDEHRRTSFRQSNIFLNVLTAWRPESEQAAKAVQFSVGTEHLFRRGDPLERKQSCHHRVSRLASCVRSHVRAWFVRGRRLSSERMRTNRAMSAHHTIGVELPTRR